MSRTTSRTANRRQRNHKPRARLETLEPRTLLSAVISTYALPSGFQALAGTYDDNDNLWVVDATSLDKVVNNSVTSFALPDPGFGPSPAGVLAGHNGHIYVTDSSGQIDDFNTATSTFATYTWDPGANGDFSPTAATITGDNALWFVTRGTSVTTSDSSSNLLTDQRTSYIGRLDPTTHAITFTTINDFDPTVSDSQAIVISAHGSDGVYVGMGVLDEQLAGNQLLFGTNRIVTASFHSATSSVMVDHVYTLNTGDTNADTYSYLTGIATDPTNGSVWFSLANSNQPSLRPVTPADRIVHGTINTVTGQLDQTAYIVPGATDTNPLTISNLAMDPQGRLWFNELQSTQMGYFDTTNNTFLSPMLTYPSSLQLDNGGAVGQIFASHTLNEASMIVFDGTPDDGSPLVKVNVSSSAPTFSNFAATLAGNHAEDTAQTLNVSFTASAPVGGTYHVAVNWGDGTPVDNVSAALVSGQYTASHNHTYSSQGTYAITVTVTDGSTASHALTINPVITDTPLTVTSFAVSNLLSRIFLSTLTFTDDIDSTASQFSVTINWGDKTTSRGLVVADPTTPGRYYVVALHQFSKKGTYNVTATVTTTEVGAAITSNTATATVVAH